MLTSLSLLLVGAGIAAICAPGSDQAVQGPPAAAHQTIQLWAAAAPGALGTEEQDIPTLTVFPAPREIATGSAVVICPGGGYGGLAPHEGAPIAEWLNGLGVSAFVLRYRLGPRYHHPVMLGDVARAIRTVRSRASEWSIDPTRIGVMGSSAGGHLASTIATHFDDGNAHADDPIDRAGSRPDLAILLYPVVTMKEPYTHLGSRANLMGENPSEALINLLSNETQVTPRTPPIFILHTADDPVVPVENALLLALALRKAGVPFDLHIYEHGPHGVGLAATDPVLHEWTAACAHWLGVRGFLAKK